MATEKSDLSYEQAKASLDEVVAKLEDKDLPLDDMVALWEQGEKLAAICESKLSSARARLEALRPSTEEN
jgi:exodeoxyribonuclease VII small subunit